MLSRGCRLVVARLCAFVAVLLLVVLPLLRVALLLSQPLLPSGACSVRVSISLCSAAFVVQVAQCLRGGRAFDGCDV